jgi:SAM-dependent methyltransferase
MKSLVFGFALLALAYANPTQEKPDPRLAEWARLPRPDVEKMKPFLGVWEARRKSDDQVSSVTTFEVRDGVVRARCRVTPAGAEPFQMEVQFVRVLDGQTLQWGLRNPSAGVILHTAKLVDENTLQGTSEPVGMPHAPPGGPFTLKRGVGGEKPAPNTFDEKKSAQESERDRKRDAWQRPAEVFDALAVKPGHRVADLGSGSGYFTFRLAARVGAQGKVYAVDIDEEAINKVRQRKERENLAQVEPILSETDDPRLSAELDVILIVDTYHEFREYDRIMQAVFRALKSGGRLGIIDGEGPAGRPRTEYHRLHTIPAELVREEIARHGFVFKDSRPGFTDAEYGKKMYFLIFEKP